MSKTFKFKSGEESPKKKMHSAKATRHVKQTSNHYCEECGKPISKIEYNKNEGICFECLEEV